MLCARCVRAVTSKVRPSLERRLSDFPSVRYSATPLSTPVTEPGEAAKTVAPALSMCQEGTVLVGLNYVKGATDPVAMKDEEYPEWLWRCLEVTKKNSGADNDGASDEFSKSKKVRREAMKRQKITEAKLLAQGDVEALASPIPLHHQSINLPGREGGTLEENLSAAETRAMLKKAMRKAQKAKIKETNYLKAM